MADVNGQYSVTFSPGFSDYLIFVSAPGFAPQRKRVTGAGDSVIMFNVALVPRLVQQLRQVAVVARRDTIERNPFPEPHVGAAERFVDGVTGMLSPEQQGNIAAGAAATLGSMPTPDGVSVLGLPANQTRTTLNGLAFGASTLPRDAATVTRVVTSGYDPSVGGFSGGQVGVELAPGTTFTRKSAHATLDFPDAQHADALSRAAGGTFRRLDVGAGGAGELTQDRLYYSASVAVMHSNAPVSSLFDAAQNVLDGVGISSDSVARLRDVLNVLGLQSNGQRPSRAQRDEVTLLGRIDHTPNARRTWGVTGYARTRRALNTDIGPTMVFGGARSAESDVILQLSHSAYFGHGYLNEFRSGVTGRWQALDPSATRQRSLITLSDGGVGSATAVPVALGGSSASLARRSFAWETTNQTLWYAPGTKHRVKLGIESRVDTDWHVNDSNSDGTYDFASLADLANGTATRFSRLLVSQPIHSTEWSGALSVGDYWEKSSSLKFLYGVRLEANRFLARPAFDAAAYSALGVRTDRLPNTVSASPRFGFSRIFRRPPSFRVGALSNSFGTFFEQPRGVLRGGIGMFRDLPAATLVGVPSGGLSRRLYLVCEGASSPPPDWALFSSPDRALPTECRADAGGSMGDAARSIQVINRAYEPPHSWRGNLTWESTLKGVAISIGALYSVNLNQPSSVDLNFRNIPQFLLGEEQNRPIYVQSSDIAPESGTIAASTARMSAAFGSVIEARSDVRSVTRQLQLRVSSIPGFGTSSLFYSAGYVLGDVRGGERGFFGTTSGDPMLLSRGPTGLDIRHQFLLQGGWSRQREFTITGFARVMSGLPFSPIVDRDINGDGLANDRAFIPGINSPFRVPLQKFIAGAPSRLRDCLTRSEGSITGINSCRGPWTVATNLRVDIASGLLGLPQRARVALNLANPLGGLDVLIHGPSHTHGWGNQPDPDPVLLNVRGFDAAARRYEYALNPRFGTATTAHAFITDAFRVTLDVHVDLSESFDKQLLTRSLRAGRNGTPGRRQSANDIAARYARSVYQLYDRILSEGDSLLLTRDQEDSLTAARARYAIATDSLWENLGERLAALPDNFDAGAALRDADETTDRFWEVVHEQAPIVKRILSPLQLRLVPTLVATLLNAPKPARVQLDFSR
jgi:hypothetical protein